MKKVIFFRYIILAFLVIFCSACVSAQNDGQTSYQPEQRVQMEQEEKREYIVQFEKDTDRDHVEKTLGKNGITDFSYLSSSEKRGYIVLINIEGKDSGTIRSLAKEKSVKNIDQNYKRKTYQQ
ncbi:MAG: hypothetical protein ACLFRO_03205 [Desulfobacterales bacterium]